MTERHAFPATEPLSNEEWFEGLEEDQPPEAGEVEAIALGNAHVEVLKERVPVPPVAPEKPQITLKDIRGLFRMADAEIALGVEPIDLLEAALEETKNDWASGWAMYGPQGMYTDDRKALLSARQIAVQSEWSTEKQGSVTDKKLDAAAHADKQYTDYLADKKLERMKWVLLDQARDIIHARMARGNAILRATSRGG